MQLHEVEYKRKTKDLSKDNIYGEEIKRLTSIALVDLKEKNKARADLGLSDIKLKVRRCLRCQKLFESLGNRLCGCTIPQDTFLPE